MDETLGDRDGHDDQRDGAETLGPRRAAEEQPPENDDQPQDGPAEDRGTTVLGREGREDEHHEPLQRDSGNAGPDAEWFHRGLQ